MNEPEVIVERIVEPPRRLVPLVFRKSYRLALGGRSDHIVQVTVGETVGIEENQVEDLLRRRIAVRPGEPLDAKRDARATAVKLTTSYRQEHGGILGAGERTVLPRHEADRLRKLGAACDDDGQDSIAPLNPTIERLRVRALKRMREHAQRVLEEVIT